VYPRPDRGVLDISETHQLGRPIETVPDLTRDIDWLYERQLAAAYPPLTAGTGAVNFARSANDRSGAAEGVEVNDLDAGCYHDAAAAVDASAATTQRRRSYAVDFSQGPGKSAFDEPDIQIEGDTLAALYPRNPRAPEVAFQARLAAARTARDPDGAFRAQTFIRAQPRWEGPAAQTVSPSATAGDGDVIVLPARPEGAAHSERDGADFGIPQGRGVVFGPGGWTEARLRGAANEENGHDNNIGGVGAGDSQSIARREERVARMMARLPRRGSGAPEPTNGGAGHGRVAIA